MSDLTVFEAGLRSEEGNYSKFMESPDRAKVEEYLEIMKTTKPDNFELMFYEKTYRLISTNPQIIYDT